MLIFIDSVLKEDRMLINDTEAVERRSVKSGERDKRGFVSTEQTLREWLKSLEDMPK